jgi:hypothetical protein
MGLVKGFCASVLKLVLLPSHQKLLVLQGSGVVLPHFSVTCAHAQALFLDLLTY